MTTAVLHREIGLRSFFKWTRRHFVLSVVIVLALAALAFYFRMWSQLSQGILTEPIQRGPIVQSVFGIGTVTGIKSFQVKIGVTSSLDHLYVLEGDTVKKMAPLAKLNGVIFRAPFAGTVTFSPFKEGENLIASSPILTLVDLSKRYLLVSLEQQGALSIRKGQKAKISFDSLREQSFDGIVRSIYSNDNNFLARVDVDQLAPQILPGMTADVAITVDVHDALIIPVAAVDQGHVWLKNGRGLPKKIEIKTGVVDRAFVEVESADLHPGDRLLIRTRPAP
jgi:macrolide-specific efflux system membrane fusion protein